MSKLGEITATFVRENNLSSIRITLFHIALRDCAHNPEEYRNSGQIDDVEALYVFLEQIDSAHLPEEIKTVNSQT